MSEAAHAVLQPAVSFPRVSGSTLLLIAALFLAHLPLLAAYAANLWALPHYQFFPLIPVGAVLLARQQLRELREVRPGRTTAYGSIWVGSINILIAAVVLNSPWLGAIATLVTLAAVTCAIGGRKLMWQLLPAWAFLWLAIRLPINLDRALLTSLQALTARWASEILDLFGVLHVMSGNTVGLPGQQVFVEEACSGVHSLFAAITATFLFVLWTKRGVMRASLLLASAVFWVLVTNALRVVLVTTILARWQLSVTEGWAHEAIGLAVFVPTLLLVLSTDNLVAFFTAAWPPQTGQAAAPHAAEPDMDSGSPAVVRLPVICRYAPWLALPFGVIGCLQLWFVGLAPATDRDSPTTAVIERFRADTLPAEWQAWKQVDFRTEKRRRNHVDGEVSHIWTYRQGNNQAVLSLDYSFVGWHELTGCYTSNGWTVTDCRLSPRGTAAEEPFGAFVEADLHKPQHDTYAFLQFGLFDEQQRPLAPAVGFGSRLGRRLKDFGEVFEALAPSPLQPGDRRTFQLQLLIESPYVRFQPSDRAEGRAFFKSACRVVPQRIGSDLSQGNVVQAARPQFP